ncbi:MFS transporter [Arsenicicoccus piscis]|uniref:MFS transporter n=1 Tax=Arsenicicoccus piscis TaxID=673954 RepID=A0ABQ6HRV8_9MICO|nr:aromatic acid/H+ symport family MFS transporter [Arsenicicoccus piscis]MCH8626561.1 MFS transporter [Arsenicicoccus piscis]GMA21208.1 MFS transporter [Arsenicicoccus piscis]
MSSSATPSQVQGMSRTPLGALHWVPTLCWAAILMDGYDAVVLGTVIPSLLKAKEWGITTAGATTVATLGLVGMVVGGLGLGFLTDKLGRRKVLMACVSAFSLFTFAAAFAPNLFMFGLLRFLAGVGLGGCLPTAIAMVGEFAHRDKTSHATTRVMTGYHVGAVLTSALAIVLISRFGWHAMFISAIVPALIVVPLMMKFLPESPSYLESVGRHEEAEVVARHYGLHVEKPVEEVREFSDMAPTHPTTDKKGLGLVMSGPYARNTLAIFVASFMGLLLVYGLNTWLPQIMQKAKYDLGNSLGMLLMLNIGAIAGLFVGGRIGDRLTPRITAVGWFLAAACFLAALTIKLPLAGMYAMIFLTGFFVFSSQVLVYAFTSANYPPAVRATALGMSAGVGRLGGIAGPLLGGLLLDRGLAYPQGFFIFAAVGLIGAIAMALTKTLRVSVGR